MTWTRLSDDFTDKPAMLRVSRSARLLHVEALVWCNRQLTDGAIPAAALPRISDSPDIGEDLRQLCSVGLWRPAEKGVGQETSDGLSDAWQLDWSDQEPAADVKARQDNRAAIQKRYRERKAKHDRGNHSMCDPRFCKAAVTGNATGNETGNETPSRPVPSRPEGRDRDRTAGTGAADAAPPGGDRWSKATTWGGTNADAHPFTAGSDGRCAYSWGEAGAIRMACGEGPKASAHGHRSELGGIPADGPHRPCELCRLPRPHPVHTDRNRSEPQ